MSKKYKIVVSDIVLALLVGSTTDADGKPAPFKFSMTCKRMTSDELGEVMSSETSLKEAVTKVARGWDGQRLVLEEDGTPAEFCDDALLALLSIPGMALLCFTAFNKATGATAKN